MAYTEWKEKTKDFAVMDVRNVQGNFFPAIKKKAESLGVGEGLTVIQTFEPKPLIPVLEGLGMSIIASRQIRHSLIPIFTVFRCRTRTVRPRRPTARWHF